MNILLILAVVVGTCVCGVLPQHTHHRQHTRKTFQNTMPHKGKEAQILAEQEKFETKEKEETVIHGDKLEIHKTKTHNIHQEDHRRSHYTQRNTDARIHDMNKRHPNRGKLKPLPGLVRLREDNTPQINTTMDCTFTCPQAESLTPCNCDPCSRTINCSAVMSFEQLFTIFHTTMFPNPRFEDFMLVSPLMKSVKGAIRSDTFLANTFGEASFKNIWIESMASLTVVEAGAFKGSEATLECLVFRWNYALTSFPFMEIQNLKVLQQLEVSGSNFTSLPTFPYNPKLSSLFLDDNFINSIPPRTFTALPNLIYLDLAFNTLYELSEDSLQFSSRDVIVFLDHNDIRYIDSRTFSGQQPILLDVSFNDLPGLAQNVFQPVLDNIINSEEDSYVDATNNPLQCPSITWVLEESMYLYFVALPEPPCAPPS